MLPCLHLFLRPQRILAQASVNAVTHFLAKSVANKGYACLRTAGTEAGVIIMAREIFRCCPEVKRQLWGGEFWTDGYFAGTVGKHGNEGMIGDYVKNQGKGYKKLHADYQLALF